ncbi:beta-glucoside-specific PTS transporter subunit IIABC [Numidum massiliense]|uniref:beta-glucoside-specific PTS transporter subunit IIABC n=1 Tax=Numidum massiliense TaxID=1522315 RepID=UPI0006D58D59|nr:beta-glucoside-specific PTS transporter subunit IIABC [Numidum massiliense]
MDHAKLARDIMKGVGGEENVRSLVHCATRLRFRLKSRDKADKTRIEQMPGVIQVMISGGQFQIVVGNEVSDVYREIMKITQLDDDGGKGEEEAGEKGNILHQAIDIISAIFTPLLGAMAGVGILKGLLIVVAAAGWLNVESGTYQILNATADSLFYFLPMLLAFTSGRKFGANPYVAVVIAGALLHPQLIEAFGEAGKLSFFGIPVVYMNYATSVIPIVLAVYVMSKLEKVLNNFFHSTVRTFFTPLMLLVVMVPLTLIVFGPFGTYVSAWLATGYSWIYDNSAILAGMFLGFFNQIFVIFGLHWGLIPIGINNLTQFGSDTFTALVAPTVFAQAGAALGVLLKSKQQKVRAIAAPATIAGIFGITEPAVYGVTLPHKEPFIMGAIAGAVGGAISGMSGAASKSFAVPGLASLPVFYGEGFGMFVVAIVVSFFLAAVLTYLFGYKDVEEDAQSEQSKGQGKNGQGKGENHTGIMESTIISSPFSGKVVPLEEVKDAVFSSQGMGKGLAVVPSEGHVHAPVKGKVTTVFPTGHAFGIRSDSGVEILIHIGIDTVQLEGQYFSPKVKQGDTVEKGQLIATCDLEAIAKEGYDLTTPIVITNTNDYLDIVSVDPATVNVGDRLLTVVK